MTTPQDVDQDSVMTEIHGSTIDESAESMIEDIVASNGVNSTKVSNGKLAMWIFLASDFLFFGGFVSAFLLYRGRSLEVAELAKRAGVEPGKVLSDVLDIPFTSVTSFILLMSSLTMVLSLAAIKRNDMRRTQLWLAATAIFGTLFLGGQIYEFTDFVREGFTLTTNQSGSTFFVLTGLHGVHIVIGIFWLTSLIGLSMSGKLSKKDAEKVEIAGLYWHFVDVIWIIIFTLVYLIPVN